MNELKVNLKRQIQEKNVVSTCTFYLLQLVKQQYIVTFVDCVPLDQMHQIYQENLNKKKKRKKKSEINNNKGLDQYDLQKIRH